jgi:hypothetical protein
MTPIAPPPGEVWFLASCIELYKDANGMSGKDAHNYLRDAGAFGFITGCWKGLHATSPAYIIESIDEYIGTHEGQTAGGGK